MEEVVGLEHLRQGHLAVVTRCRWRSSESGRRRAVNRTNRASSIPLVSVGDDGKMIRSETFCSGVEADLVVGLGQDEHRLGDRLEFALCDPVAHDVARAMAAPGRRA